MRSRRNCISYALQFGSTQAVAGQIVLKRIAPLLLLLAASGCSKPDELFTTKSDVTMRLGAPDPCSYCETIRYQSDDGKFSDPLPVGPIIIRSEDIEFVARGYEPGHEIKFAYKESAQDRILGITSRNVGKTILVMTGGKAIGMARISEPFSNGSEIGGIPSSEADYIIGQVADQPYVP